MPSAAISSKSCDEWEEQKYKVYSKVLDMINAVKLPFLRVNRRFQRLLPRSIVKIERDDPKSRMLSMVVDLPGKPVGYVIYFSAQDWYMTPSKVQPKIKKVIAEAQRLRAKYGPDMPVFMAIVCKRFTSGAEKLVEKHGFRIGTFKWLLRVIQRYFYQRYSEMYRGCLDKGVKRIWGNYVLNAAIISELAREFGLDLPHLDHYRVALLMMNGVSVDEFFKDIPPPPRIPPDTWRYE